MNEYLQKLKKRFGKYGSWALWDENGCIENIIQRFDFESLLKPNIMFVGLNASLKVQDDWTGYHSECLKIRKKNKSWCQSPIHKLAEVLQEKDFDVFRGAYMTDIIKDCYYADSQDVRIEVKKDPTKISENIKKFKDELRMLAKISGHEEFYIICIGTLSYEIVNTEIKNNVFKVFHYANYGEKKVKARIRKELLSIAKNIRKLSNKSF